MDTAKQKSEKLKLPTKAKTSNRSQPVKPAKKLSESTDFDDKRCYSVDAWDYMNDDEDLSYEFR